MKVTSWEGTLELKCSEGSDTGRVTLKIGGQSCEREELAAKVSGEVDRLLKLFGDKAVEAKKLAALQAELDKVNIKLKLHEEANRSVVPAQVEAPAPKLPDKPVALPPPVQEKHGKGKRGL